MLMMIANSIGFTLGLDGTRYVVRQMFSSLAGARSRLGLGPPEADACTAFMPVIAVIVQLFMLCHVMFALRCVRASPSLLGLTQILDRTSAARALV
jgi:hypothetical protein